MRLRFASLLLTISSILRATAVTPAGGFLNGRCVALNSNRLLTHRDVYACREGSEVGFRARAIDGRFDFGEVPSGRYSLAFINPWYNSGDEMERTGWVTGIVVEKGRRTTVDLCGQWDVGLLLGSRRGNVWSDGYAEHAQSFVARGGNLIKLSVGVASRPMPIDVTVHRIRVDGPQLGPARSFNTTHEGHVFWSAGDVPLLPGERYFVRLRSRDGTPWSAYLCGIGDGYPSGLAHFDGHAQPGTDLAINISTDCDGLTTAFAGPPPFDSKGSNLGAWVTQSAGQTFVALGTNILLAAVPVAVAGTKPESETIGQVRLGLREDGPDGDRIAPPRVVPFANDWQAVALWSPGEARTVPGDTYYLEISLAGGAGFFSYAGFDRYSLGSAFRDGKPDMGRDICGRVLCNGGGGKHYAIYNVRMASGDLCDHGVVSFSTNQRVTAEVIVGGARYTASQKPSLEHQADNPLAGANSFRIECGDGAVSPWFAAGTEGTAELATTDYPPPPLEMRNPSYHPGRNLLVNGSFEEAGESGIPMGWQIEGEPHGYTTGPQHGLFPPDGECMFGWSRRRTPGAPRAEVLRTDRVYQEVATRPGQSYITEAWIYTAAVHGDPKDFFDGRDGQVRVRLFAQPQDSGKREHAHRTQFYCTCSEWLHIRHLWTAQSSRTLVGAAFFQWYDLARASAYVDNIRLTEVASQRVRYSSRTLGISR